MAVLIKKKVPKSRANPLKSDPSQTGALRRLFSQGMARKMNELQRRITDLVVTQDVFGLREPVNPLVNFDPSQPRVPAGSSHGGEFASTRSGLLSSSTDTPVSHFFEFDSDAASRYKISKATHTRGEVKQIQLSGLIATQKTVDNKTVLDYMKHPDKPTTGGLSFTGVAGSLPLIVQHGNKRYILDGHHRLVAENLRGSASVLARVITVPTPVSNVFCPTGPGGGVDPSCGKGGESAHIVIDQIRRMPTAESDEKTQGRGREIVNLLKKPERDEIKVAFKKLIDASSKKGKAGTEVVDVKFSAAQIKDLVYSGQKNLAESSLIHMINSGGERGDPVAFQMDGKIYLRDGNHRVVAAMLLGKSLTIQVAHIKAEPLLVTNAQSLTSNTRWQFNTTSQQVEAFLKWLADQMQELFYQQAEDSWWNEYIRRGWQQGANRAWNAWKTTPKTDLLNAFNQPVSLEKVKLLAGRVLTELKGVTQAMATTMSRTLVDGLVRGDSPRDVGKALNTSVDKIGRVRANAIAQTETVRAHAEGQLDMLESVGMQNVGVMVEWSTSHLGVTRITGSKKRGTLSGGNPSPCGLCKPMEGVVFSLSEARGMIPRHPNCRCSFIPAGVGEDIRGQKLGKKQISAALDASIRAEIPPTSKRTLAEQRSRTSWAGADAEISAERPQSVLNFDPSQPRIPAGSSHGGEFAHAVVDDGWSLGSKGEPILRKAGKIVSVLLPGMQIPTPRKLKIAVKRVERDPVVRPTVTSDAVSLANDKLALLPIDNSGMLLSHPLKRDPDEVMSHWMQYDIGSKVPKHSPTVDVPIDKIDLEEAYLYRSKIKEYINQPPTEAGTAFSGGGRYYLMDGNHRVIAAHLRGEKTVRLRVASARENM